MSEHEYKDLKIGQHLSMTRNDDGTQKVQSILYSTNIVPGDYVERLIFFNEILVKNEIYKITEVKNNWLHVKYRTDEEGEKNTGVIDLCAMLREYMPAPDVSIKVHHRIIKGE